MSGTSSKLVSATTARTIGLAGRAAAGERRASRGTRMVHILELVHEAEQPRLNLAVVAELSGGPVAVCINASANLTAMA